jgi:hypothetical protein
MRHRPGRPEIDEPFGLIKKEMLKYMSFAPKQSTMREAFSNAEGHTDRDPSCELELDVTGRHPGMVTLLVKDLQSPHQGSWTIELA